MPNCGSTSSWSASARSGRPSGCMASRPPLAAPRWSSSCGPTTSTKPVQIWRPRGCRCCNRRTTPATTGMRCCAIRTGIWWRSSPRYLETASPGRWPGGVHDHRLARLRRGHSCRCRGADGPAFVALSVRSDAVSASRTLASRAAQTLVLFMTSVLVAVLLVAPQPSAALGSELLALAIASGTILLILDRRAGHSAEKGPLRYIERFSPNMITAAFVGVAGITFLVKAGGGLYWLIPAAMASLLGGVVNAWLFLVKVTE